MFSCEIFNRLVFVQPRVFFIKLWPFRDNSYYFMPTVTATPVDFLKVRLAILNAWSHKQEDYLFQAGRKRHIGTEIDLGIDLMWGKGSDTLKHMFFRLEGGYMIFGKQVSPDYRSPGIFSIQARIAFVL